MVARCCRWTRAPNHCPRWGTGPCPERRPPITAPYNEAPRTYWRAARSTDPRPRARLNGRRRSKTRRRTVRINFLDNRRNSSSNSRAVVTRLIGKCHRDHRRNPRRSRRTGLFTRTRVKTVRKYDRCTSAGEDEAARSWPWWARGTRDRSHNKPVVPSRRNDLGGCRGSSIYYSVGARSEASGRQMGWRTSVRGLPHPVMREGSSGRSADSPGYSGENILGRDAFCRSFFLRPSVFPMSLFMYYFNLFYIAGFVTDTLRVYMWLVRSTFKRNISRGERKLTTFFLRYTLF